MQNLFTARNKPRHIFLYSPEKTRLLPLVETGILDKSGQALEYLRSNLCRNIPSLGILRLVVISYFELVIILLLVINMFLDRYQFRQKLNLVCYVWLLLDLWKSYFLTAFQTRHQLNLFQILSSTNAELWIVHFSNLFWLISSETQLIFWNNFCYFVFR